MKTRRGEAIEHLRAAAAILEAEAGEWILPGWDVEHEPNRERCAGIREAAHAVAADSVDADHCTRVNVRKIGFLARYIGDILEE